MSTYSEKKMEVLTMAQERRAKGFATHEFEDAGLVRTWVSELREEGHEFVTFQLPGVSASRYALSQFVGTKHDGYMALRAVHPDAKVKRDDRLPSKRKPMAAPFEESPRAEQARRSAGTRRPVQAYGAGGRAARDYLLGRRRLLESIENVTSIPASLMSADVPAEDVTSLLSDLTELRAYADTLIAYIHGKVEDAAFDERIDKLRNVEGRPPEEAASFLAAADRLERQRQHRLSA